MKTGVFAGCEMKTGAFAGCEMKTGPFVVHLHKTQIRVNSVLLVNISELLEKSFPSNLSNVKLHV